MNFYKSTIILVSLYVFLIPSTLAQAKKPTSNNYQILEERIKLNKENASLQFQNIDTKNKNFEEKNDIKLKAQNDKHTLLIQELEARINIYLSVFGFIFAILTYFGFTTLSKFIKSTIETKTLEEIKKKVTDETIEGMIKKSGEQAIKNLIKELNDTMKTEFSRIEKLRDDYEKGLPELLAKTKDIPTKPSEESSQELKDFEQKLTEIKKEQDYSANDWFLKGYNSASQDNHQEAINDYTKTIELDPNNANAYYNRGVSFGHLKQYEQEIEDYNKAIELDPNNANAYSNRGVSFGNLKQYEQGIEDYNKAIEIDPNFISAYLNRVELLIILNKPEQALETCEKILVSVTKVGEKIILNYLVCIAKRILKQNTEANYKNLIELLQSDFSIDFSFKEIETWIENESLDEEDKIFFNKMTATIKEKQRKS